MPDPTEGTPRRIKPFNEFLIEQRKGDAALEWGERLNELVEAVTLHQKKGRMTITIDVTPVGSRAALEVIDEVKLTLPKAPPEGSLFFADDEGNLCRSDPRQTSFEGLRDVSVSGEADKVIDVATGEVV